MVSGKKGVVYGFRTFGAWGEDGTIYYFGRSRQALLQDVQLLNNEDLQKEMLVRRLKLSGLNKPAKMLFWLRVVECDVQRLWSGITEHLKANFFIARAPGKKTPLITQHLWVGDNWFSVKNMGEDEFSEWCSEVVQKEVQRARQTIRYDAALRANHPGLTSGSRRSASERSEQTLKGSCATTCNTSKTWFPARKVLSLGFVPLGRGAKTARSTTLGGAGRRSCRTCSC